MLLRTRTGRLIILDSHSPNGCIKAFLPQFINSAKGHQTSIARRSACSVSLSFRSIWAPYNVSSPLLFYALSTTMPFLDVNPSTVTHGLAHTYYVRDFKAQITPNDTQKVTLIVAGCYILVIGILWYACDGSIPFINLYIPAEHRHVPYLNKISE
jgi:hypothetical protein